MSNELEQLEFKLEKNYWDLETCRKSQNFFCFLGQSKFVFPKKATKFGKLFTVDLTLTTHCQIEGEDFFNFCGLLRKHELYLQPRLTFLHAQVRETLIFGIIGFVEMVFIFSFIRMKSYGSSFASSLKIAYQAITSICCSHILYQNALTFAAQCCRHKPKQFSVFEAL